MNSITKLLSKSDREEILQTFSTIGGFIIFPSNKVDNKLTINGSRGFNSRIVDRFDLTLECIRRFYLGIESPKAYTIKKIAKMFGGKIEILPERRGNRMTADVMTDIIFPTNYCL